MSLCNSSTKVQACHLWDDWPRWDGKDRKKKSRRNEKSDINSPSRRWRGGSTISPIWLAMRFPTARLCCGLAKATRRSCSRSGEGVGVANGSVLEGRSTRLPRRKRRDHIGGWKRQNEMRMARIQGEESETQLTRTITCSASCLVDPATSSPRPPVAPPPMTVSSVHRTRMRLRGTRRGEQRGMVELRQALVPLCDKTSGRCLGSRRSPLHNGIASRIDSGTWEVSNNDAPVACRDKPARMNATRARWRAAVGRVL